MHENRNEHNTGTKTIKKIGKVTYEVVVHFNENATETMQDKLKRIMLREMEIEKQHSLSLSLIQMIPLTLWSQLCTLSFLIFYVTRQMMSMEDDYLFMSGFS